MRAAEAAFVKILGGALSNNYLRMRGIEAQRALYDRVGPGDKVIVTDGQQVLPMIR